jgi:hypothetical protein
LQSCFKRKILLLTSPLFRKYVSTFSFYSKKVQLQSLWESVIVLGKTVPSYRMALEDEIRRWNGFAKALRIEDREAFEALMDACRSYASAGSNATQPILFEPMIMSILLFQQKKLSRLEKTIDAGKQFTTN